MVIFYNWLYNRTINVMESNMLRKIQKASLFALISFVFIFAPTSAVKTASAQVDLLSGQSQYYTVMMRSDKQSLVYAKITFDNASNEDDKNNFSFTLPDDVKIENLGVQQILAKATESKICEEYETYEDFLERQAANNSSLQSEYYYNNNKQCLTYQETSEYNEDFDYDTNTSSNQDQYSYNYYINLNTKTNSKFDYKDLDSKADGQTYTVELASPVKPGKQGAILISYTSKSYISGGFLGRYTYDFRTFTANQLVSKATVAINFDDDLYSELTASTREVSSSEIQNGVNFTQNSATDYSSPKVDKVYYSIGKGGRYIKQKTQLLPNDTFSVRGSFSTSKWVLSLPTIAKWTLGSLLVIVGLFFGYKLYRKKHPKTKKTFQPKNDKDYPINSSESSIENVNTEISEQNLASEKIDTSIPYGSDITFLIERQLKVTAVSLGVTVLVGLCLFGLFMIQASNDVFVQGSNASMFVGLLFLITLFLFLTTTLFVGPIIYMIRYGKEVLYRWLLLHGVLTFVLLAIVIIAITLISGDKPDHDIYPMYYQGVSD